MNVIPNLKIYLFKKTVLVLKTSILNSKNIFNLTTEAFYVLLPENKNADSAV